MQPQPLNRRRKSEQGYILVTLTLFVALLAVAAMAIAPSLIFQIQRDREEETIHRGVQYSRAIQKYFKKFGRYPTSIKDLENTNNIRFLRKAYKDPMTGKDFKLLHYSEVQMMSAGPPMAGATPVSAMGGTGTSAATSSSTGFSLAPATGPGGSPADPNSSPNSPGEQNATGSDSATPQIMSGPIVGVISTSKAKTIREFGGKNHYNQWQFIYDPGTQQMSKGLINTPEEPPIQIAAPNLNGPGQPGTSPGAASSAFSSSPSSPTPIANPTGTQSQPPQTPNPDPAAQPPNP